MIGIYPPRQILALDRPPPGTPVNPASEFFDSLVACWPFWEGAGGQFEDPVGGYSAAMFNFSQTPSSGWGAFGDFGSVPIFNGLPRGDAGTNPAAFQRVNNFTIELWFVITSEAANQALFSQSDNAPYLRINTAGKMEFLQSQVAVLATGATSINAFTVHHAAVTVDRGNNILLFLDGKQDASANGTVATGFTGHLLLGADHIVSAGNGTEQLHGSLFRVSYYARALPRAAISNLADPSRMWDLFRSRRQDGAYTIPSTSALLMRRRRALAA